MYIDWNIGTTQFGCRWPSPKVVVYVSMEIHCWIEWKANGPLKIQLALMVPIKSTLLYGLRFPMKCLSVDFCSVKRDNVTRSGSAGVGNIAKPLLRHPRNRGIEGGDCKALSVRKWSSLQCVQPTEIFPISYYSSGAWVKCFLLRSESTFRLHNISRWGSCPVICWKDLSHCSSLPASCLEEDPGTNVV